MNLFRYRNEIYFKLRTFYEVFDEKQLLDLEKLSKKVTFVQDYGFETLNNELEKEYDQGILLDTDESRSDYPPPDPLISLSNILYSVIDNFYQRHKSSRPDKLEPLVTYCLHSGIEKFEKTKLRQKYFEGIAPDSESVETWRNEIYRSLHSFYELTAPAILRSPSDMCRLVSFIEKFGFDELNEKLRSKYGGTISLQHSSFKRVPYPNPQILLRNKIYGELHEFYQRHEDTKPDELDPIVEYILENGKEKFDEKLIKKYGEGLSKRKVRSILDLDMNDI